MSVYRARRTVELEIPRSISASHVKGILPEDDDKLQTLIRLIGSIDTREKILIFSQFSDTAEYLYQSMKHLTGSMRKIDGSSGNIHPIVRRFAPRSNNYRLQENEEEIRILITTDVLSEGLNLQDCSIVINYDLHWNPVRLIQRMGRVDRIGTTSERIRALNFLPEQNLEKRLHLAEKLRERIREIHRTIGEDAGILEKDEELNEESMYAIYMGDSSILEEEEDREELSLSGIEEQVRNLKVNHPEYYNYVLNIPDGVRSAMTSDELDDVRYIMMETDSTHTLMLTDREGNVITRDLIKVLESIQCERNTPRAPLPPRYNQSIVKATRKFELEYEQAASELHARGNLPGTVREYLRRELQSLYHSSSSETVRNNIGILFSIFERNLPENAVRAIRVLVQKNYSGEELLAELGILYRNYGLAAPLESAQASSHGSPVTPKLVCSEAIY